MNTNPAVNLVVFYVVYKSAQLRPHIVTLNYSTLNYHKLH